MLRIRLKRLSLAGTRSSASFALPDLIIEIMFTLRKPASNAMSRCAFFGAKSRIRRSTNFASRECVLMLALLLRRRRI